MIWSDSSNQKYGELDKELSKEPLTIPEPATQNNHFKISKMFQLIHDLIVDLESDKGITKSYSRLYLSKNSWSLKNVENFMQSSNYEFPNYEENPKNIKSCLICEDTSQIKVKLTCNHQICKSCLSIELKSSLRSIEDCFNLKCSKCGFLIDEELFCEDYLDDYSLEMYHLLLITSFTASKKVVSCKSMNCENSTVINDGKDEYLCNCGEKNCSSCGFPFHSPLNCEENEFWVSHLPEAPVFQKFCLNDCCKVTDENKQFFTCNCKICFCIWCYSLADQHPKPCEDQFGVVLQIEYFIQRLEKCNQNIEFIQCYAAHLFNLFHKYDVELMVVDIKKDYSSKQLERLYSTNKIKRRRKVEKALFDLPKKFAFLCASVCFYDFEAQLFALNLRSLFTRLIYLVKRIEKNFTEKNMVKELEADTRKLEKMFDSVLSEFKTCKRRY